MSSRKLASHPLLWQDNRHLIDSMDTFLSIIQTAWLIILVILFFNLMIFVHELGHFLAGKWRGAYIDRFQIWFGKPIWSKVIGGVRWGIGWIPAGGFVSLPQMEDMESIEGTVEGRPKNLKPLKALDKVIIAAAGPLFSLLLAYAFAFIVWGVGKPAADMQGTTIGYLTEDSTAAQAGLLPGDTIRAIDGQPVTKWMGNMEGVRELVAMSEGETIRFTIDRPQPDGSTQRLDIDSHFRLPETSWWQRSALRQVGILPAAPALVGHILPHSPAAQAGLTEGQRIISLDGQPVYTPLAISLASEKGAPLQLGLQNADGTTTTATLTPAVPDNWKGLDGARPVLGFTWGNPYGDIRLEHPNPQAQVNQSLKWMKDTLEKVCSPGSSIGMEHLSGPVGIGSYMYRMMEAGDGMGWRLVLWFAVVLNVNLAVLNILPLPVVDGGHVVLGIAEMIRRKPVSGKCLDWLMTGFVFLLLAFFVFVTFKDVGDLVGGDKDEASRLPDPVFSTPQP